MAKLFASEVARQVTNDARPGARRLRLRHRVQGRALPARREADRDRRGDERDPAHGHRPQPARRARDVTRSRSSGPIPTPRPGDPRRPTSSGAACARFLRAAGCADLEALQARAVADPAWFWEAAVADIGVRFDPEPGTDPGHHPRHRMGPLVQSAPASTTCAWRSTSRPLRVRTRWRWSGRGRTARCATSPAAQLRWAVDRAARAMAGAGRRARRSGGHLPADDPRGGDRGPRRRQARRDLHPDLLRLRRRCGGQPPRRLRGQAARHRRRLLRGAASRCR